MLYMISFATETPIKTCNMSLAWEPPYNIMNNTYLKQNMYTYNNIRALMSNVHSP